MANQYYSTVAAVIKNSGANYQKLGLSGKAELEEMIEEWLEQIYSMINRDRGGDLLNDLSFGEKKVVDYGVESWNELTVPGITVAIETDPEELPKYQESYAVNQIQIDNTIVGTGTIIASKEIEEGRRDLSNAKMLQIKVKPYVDTTAGDLQLLLSSAAECGTIIKTVDFPAMIDYEWKLVNIYLGNDSSLAEIKSIGLKLINSVGSYLWVADIRKVVMPKAIDNIAMRACTNMVKIAYATRESSTVGIEGLNATMFDSKVLTDSLKEELGAFYKKADFSFSTVKGKINNTTDYPISEVD
jgi:hypothetical protein